MSINLIINALLQRSVSGKQIGYCACINCINQLSMKNLHFVLIVYACFMLVTSCNHNKPKPVSKNITKTTVTVNGQKDSVINNPAKNYGMATISGPCTKLLLQNIQATDEFKTLITGKQPKDITYVANWVKAAEPKIESGNGKITNGIEVIINDKSAGNTIKLGSYVFNNEDGKLYFSKGGKPYQMIKDVDTTALKQIRNGCYWGVASHQ